MPRSGYLSPCSRRLSVALLLSLAASTLVGCQTTHVVTADDNGAPQFESLTIVYDVNDAVVGNPEIEPPVTLDEVKSGPLRAALVSRTTHSDEPVVHSNLRLKVQCPHPDGDVDSALVSVAAPLAGSDLWQAVAEQTIPRKDVELLLVHLVNGGICDTGTPVGCPTRLAMEIDGHRVEKPWARERRLDRLAVDTYDSSRH